MVSDLFPVERGVRRELEGRVGGGRGAWQIVEYDFMAFVQNALADGEGLGIAGRRQVMKRALHEPECLEGG